MDQATIIQYVRNGFEDVDIVTGSKEAGSPEISWGDTFFIYNPGHNPKNAKFPFATIVTKDYGDFDKASNLDRPGVYRLNVGVSKATFQLLFGAAEPSGVDFAAMDQILPHPAYWKMHWICVLNPSDTTFEMVKPLLAEAHTMVTRKHVQR